MSSKGRPLADFCMLGLSWLVDRTVAAGILRGTLRRPYPDAIRLAAQ
jgi:hypothetical protein